MFRDSRGERTSGTVSAPSLQDGLIRPKVFAPVGRSVSCDVVKAHSQSADAQSGAEPRRRVSTALLRRIQPGKSIAWFLWPGGLRMGSQMRAEAELGGVHRAGDVFARFIDVC